jgi:nucleoside-diphosphate-sugar epimerase
MKFGTADNPQLLEDMNVRTPARVAGRYRASRIVALSTGNVYSYAAPASRGPTESGETQPPGSYGRSCLRKERAFIDASREFGTPGAIIRLNYAIGIRYGVLNDIARRVLAEEPVSLEAGYVNVIWQGDAVAHILQALPATASPPVILNVTGPEVLRVRDVAEQFARRFGTTAMFSGTEPETALLSNAGKSHQLFGPPQVGIEELLDWTAQWLRQGGETLNKPTHFEVRSGEF